MAAPNSVAPELLWAQRSNAETPEKNIIFLTINVPNLPAPPATKFDLTSTGFEFSAKVGDASKGIESKEYHFKLDFFAEIDVDNSKYIITSKSLSAVLRKKEAKEEFWPRLTKDKVRLHNLKTDFDKWVDEDEQDEAEENPMGGDGGFGGAGGLDPSMMGMGGAGGMGMPGMGGMGGMGGGEGGFDLQSLMAQMGQGGAGGMPNFDMPQGDDDDDDEAAPADAPAAAETDDAATKAKDVLSVD